MNLYAICFEIRPNHAIFEQFLHFWKCFDDATDAASSSRSQRVCPRIGKGKFDFFGPPTSLLT